MYEMSFLGWPTLRANCSSSMGGQVFSSDNYDSGSWWSKLWRRKPFMFFWWHHLPFGTHWTMLREKSITSYDETRIVDQRVHVLWQFNVDKPTKTYKNQAATWEDMDHPSNGKTISGAPACSSTTLHSLKICQVPLSPTKATLETDTTATGRQLKGKKWHFVTKNGQ